jgi:hypothetical protein
MALAVGGRVMAATDPDALDQAVQAARRLMARRGKAAALTTTNCHVHARPSDSSPRYLPGWSVDRRQPASDEAADLMWRATCLP